MTLLIDKTDISNEKDISKHTTLDRVNEFISDAQVMDLCPLLGNAFYFDLVANYTDPNYQLLLNGGSFDVNGCTWTHRGLKSVLIEFAWGRYTYYGVNNDTGFGSVIKTTDFSTPTQNSDRRDIWTNSKQKANAYFSVIKQYLDLNPELFPKWANDCGSVCGEGKKNNFKYNVIS